MPFSFIPTSGSTVDPQPGPPLTRVRAMEERKHLAIAFPRVRSYRFDIAAQHLAAEFTPDSTLALSTRDVPSRTEMQAIVGEADRHTLDDLKLRREQEVIFGIAKRVHGQYFADEPSAFPQLVRIARQWLAAHLELRDNTFVQMLLLHELADRAAERMYKGVVRGAKAQERVRAVLSPYERAGSTAVVDFDTGKPVMRTDVGKSHVSHVVADTDSWEQKTASTLEEMDEVLRYVKNEGLGFTIPYALDGRSRSYMPDFIAVLDDGHGEDDPLHLVVEVSGERLESKLAKVTTAREFWVPGVNELREFGRWAFIEISDPWATAVTIRAFLAQLANEVVA